MLVLRAEKGDRVALIQDGEIIGYVVLTAVRSGRCRIGFDGFAGMRIVREKLLTHEPAVA